MNLEIATLKELDNAVNFAYKLQTNIETRCRPLAIHCDKLELYNLFKKHIIRDLQDLILVYEKQELIGVTPFYWIEEDLYVSYYQGIYAIDYKHVASFILDYIENRFEGYKFYVNTAKEHIQSNEFYKHNEFVLLEEATMLELKPKLFDISNYGVELLNEKNKEVLFSSINKLVDEDTYWNVERLSNHLDKFIILGIFKPNLQGHIIGRKGSDGSIEIISLLGDLKIKKKLITALVNESHHQKIRVVQLYTEEFEEVEIGVSLGFNIYDNNVCYIKYI